MGCFNYVEEKKLNWAFIKEVVYWIIGGNVILTSHQPNNQKKI
jgi:hypothetical protein